MMAATTSTLGLMAARIVRAGRDVAVNALKKSPYISARVALGSGLNGRGAPHASIDGARCREIRPRDRGTLSSTRRERQGLRDLHPGYDRPRQHLECRCRAHQGLQRTTDHRQNTSPPFYPVEVAATGKCDLELEIAAREGRFEEEGWRLRHDGSRLWASVTITALRNPDGVLVGFAKVTQDLTQRRAAEDAERALAAQRAALAEQERIQAFQERFLAILGHDLRNPLAALGMGAGILRQRTMDPAMLQVIDRMDASARRMSRMIEQILDFTRARLAGGLALSLEKVDLRAALETIVNELAAAYPSRDIRLSCPPLIGVWDRDRLEQVFSNLVGNAILHGSENTVVTITARLEPEAVQIEVHNQGPGIPSELQPLLFNPFRRGERDSRTAKTAGLGLGLYICHELVLAHGGTLDFRSDSTNGTTFRVTLPRTTLASQEAY